MADAQSQVNSTGPKDNNGCMFEYTLQNIEVTVTIRLRHIATNARTQTAIIATLLC
jgi:hypothetical protein